MIVYIRGAGDIATGIALRLHRSGMQIIMSDISVPTSIRRTVCFSEAIRNGSTMVEDVKAVLAHNREEALRITGQGEIAVVVDPEANLVKEIQPDAVVDAILAKRNLGTKITDAKAVVAVGPGFYAGKDCHAVIETKRGHTLGRVIYEGSAIPNTGIPGMIGGYSAERVMHAPCDGIFRTCCSIGDVVKAGDAVAMIGEEPVRAKIDGMVRGLLQDGIRVHKGLKCSDVDPRGAQVDYMRSSDKALSVGGGVLEAVLHLTGVLKG